MLNKEKVFTINNLDEKDASVALLLIPGLGNRRFLKLRARFGSSLNVWSRATPDNLSSLVPENVVKKILAGPDYEGLARLKNRLEAMKAWMVFIDDPEYPLSLKEIDNPPVVIFGLGAKEALKQRAIAIVGSRKASSYGLRVCASLARDLVQEGFTIVSGLAMGIDACAHKAALDSNGRTIAVKGCGLDVNYPQRNAQLAEKIKNKGAVISEFFPGVTAEPGNFPRRNRIISALSLAVIVVEGGLRSGSLITAYLGLEQGKEVMAVPGSIFSYGSRGCHKLIKEGAALVESAKDVLDALNMIAVTDDRRPNVGSAFDKVGSSSQTAIIVDKLKGGPQHIDEIASACSIPVAKVASILLELELQDVAVAHGNGVYSLMNMDE